MTFPETLFVEPFAARQCGVCHRWIYVAGGPFAEGDPTKTLADLHHVERQHPEVIAACTFGVPYMRWNEIPIIAYVEPTDA